MTAEDDEIVGELTEPVRAALDEAVELVESLLEELTSDHEEEAHESCDHRAVGRGRPSSRRVAAQLPELQRYLKIRAM